MKDELFAIGNHLAVLEQSNKELEMELDNFMREDDKIKARLRSKTPPKTGNSRGNNTLGPSNTNTAKFDKQNVFGNNNNGFR